MHRIKKRRREDCLITLEKSDVTGDWWWRMYSKSNKKQTGGTTEGYKNRMHCIDNCYEVTGWLPDNVIYEVEVLVRAVK